MFFGCFFWAVVVLDHLRIIFWEIAPWDILQQFGAANACGELPRWITPSSTRSTLPRLRLKGRSSGDGRWIRKIHDLITRSVVDLGKWCNCATDQSEKFWADATAGGNWDAANAEMSAGRSIRIWRKTMPPSMSRKGESKSSLAARGVVTGDHNWNTLMVEHRLAARFIGARPHSPCFFKIIFFCTLCTGCGPSKRPDFVDSGSTMVSDGHY